MEPIGASLSDLFLVRVIEGRTRAVEELLRGISDPAQLTALLEARDTDGLPALHVAAARGYDVLVGVLLEHGADVALRAGRDRCTPLHLAAAAGHVATAVELLRDTSESSSSPEELLCLLDAARGETPLIAAVRSGSPLEVVRALAQRMNRTLLVVPDANGLTALHHAAAHGDRRVARLLVHCGASLAALDDSHRTAAEAIEELISPQFRVELELHEQFAEEMHRSQALQEGKTCGARQALGPRELVDLWLHLTPDEQRAWPKMQHPSLRLGSGQFGRVMEVDVPRIGVCAVKMPKANPQVDYQSLERQMDFMREACMLALAGQHPHLVRLKGIVWNPPSCDILLEHCEHDFFWLFGARRGYDGQPIPRAVRVRLLLDVARALEFLHKQNIVHRDVKPANMFILRGVTKLGDLGEARFNEIGDSMRSLHGTPRYLAPELIRSAKRYTGRLRAAAAAAAPGEPAAERERALCGEEGALEIPLDPYTERCDVFSFAMVMYEVLEGRLPFEMLRPPEALEAIVRMNSDDKRTLPAFRATPETEGLWNLVLKCWSSNASDRPPFSRVSSQLGRVWRELRTEQSYSGRAVGTLRCLSGVGNSSAAHGKTAGRGAWCAQFEDSLTYIESAPMGVWAGCGHFVVLDKQCEVWVFGDNRCGQVDWPPATSSPPTSTSSVSSSSPGASSSSLSKRGASPYSPDYYGSSTTCSRPQLKLRGLGPADAVRIACGGWHTLAYMLCVGDRRPQLCGWGLNDVGQVLGRKPATGGASGGVSGGGNRIVQSPKVLTELVLERPERGVAGCAVCGFHGAEDSDRDAEMPLQQQRFMPCEAGSMQLSAGLKFSAALAGNSVYVWGQVHNERPSVRVLHLPARTTVRAIAASAYGLGIVTRAGRLLQLGKFACFRAAGAAGGGGRGRGAPPTTTSDSSLSHAAPHEFFHELLGRKIVQLSAGSFHALALARVWGVTTTTSSPTSPTSSTSPTSLTSPSNPVASRSGTGSSSSSTSASRSSSSRARLRLYAWGENCDGQCGCDPEKHTGQAVHVRNLVLHTYDVPQPVEVCVPNLETAAESDVTLYSGFANTSAVRVGDRLYMWGRGSSSYTSTATAAATSVPGGGVGGRSGGAGRDVRAKKEWQPRVVPTVRVAASPASLSLFEDGVALFDTT